MQAGIAAQADLVRVQAVYAQFVGACQHAAGAESAHQAAHRALDGVSLDGAAVGQYEFNGTTMIGSKHKFAKVGSAVCSHLWDIGCCPTRCKCASCPCSCGRHFSLRYCKPTALETLCMLRCSGLHNVTHGMPQLHGGGGDICTHLISYLEAMRYCCCVLQAVERKTLARQCPTLLTLLKAFPKTMELQEPTFKDIVVVYRYAAKQMGLSAYHVGNCRTMTLSQPCEDDSAKQVLL